jgi:hypothetical protein
MSHRRGYLNEYYEVHVGLMVACERQGGPCSSSVERRLRPYCRCVSAAAMLVLLETDRAVSQWQLPIVLRSVNRDKHNPTVRPSVI